MRSQKNSFVEFLRILGLNTEASKSGAKKWRSLICLFCIWNNPDRQITFHAVKDDLFDVDSLKWGHRFSKKSLEHYSVMDLFKKSTLHVLFIFTKAEFPHNLLSSDCLMILIMQIETHKTYISTSIWGSKWSEHSFKVTEKKNVNYQKMKLKRFTQHNKSPFKTHVTE